MNIKEIIIEKIENYAKLRLDVDKYTSTFHWEPRHDVFNGDVFEGDIYLKNSKTSHYHFVGILKIKNNNTYFDLKELEIVSCTFTRRDLIKEECL